MSHTANTSASGSSSGNDEKGLLSPTEISSRHEGVGNSSDEDGSDEQSQDGIAEEEYSVDGAGDDEDDEDDDDEEPALKYERIGGSIPDLLKKDSASAMSIASKFMALGTHAGVVHLVDLSGTRIKSYKRHMASISDICVDETSEFIATSSIDGQVCIISLSTKEHYNFDLHRPMLTVCLEPFFSKHSTRSFVCGGLAGSLLLYEKTWFGHSTSTLHLNEGPIYVTRWQGRLIAWANDLGVKIYDTISKSRITFIDRPPGSPRADLFRCTLRWQDDSTLLIAWADHIKVARIRERTKAPGSVAGEEANVPLMVEITAVFRLDCMVSGLVPYPLPSTNVPGSNPESRHQLQHRPASIVSQTSSETSTFRSIKSQHSSHTSSPLTSFLILAYTPPDPSLFTDSTALETIPIDKAQQARLQADRPELRIISRKGEELAADALSVTDYKRWQCNDYILDQVNADSELSLALASDQHGLGVKERANSYVVLSPKDLILVRSRDRIDHVAWLLERGMYEEALVDIEDIESLGLGMKEIDEKGASDTAVEDGKEDATKRRVEVGGVGLNSKEIGQRYVEHLVSRDDFPKAASLTPKVCGRDPKRWENWIFAFAEKNQLKEIIPYVPTDKPKLDRLVYEMMVGYFLVRDRKTLLQVVREWPKDIYDIAAVIVAIQAELEKIDKDKNPPVGTSLSEERGVLMECLAELYTSNRQPGKALPFYLRLRRPNVFNLIRENNLYTDVKDQVLELVEFDMQLREKDRSRVDDETVGKVDATTKEGKGEAIELLVNNVHSIPIGRVVQQLHAKPKYLFLYLDAVMNKDPNLLVGFSDLHNLQVELYADYARPRLIDFLRSSTEYNLEKAYKVCQDRDLIPEMVFLLGRAGDNKRALTLIIERLGDVHRAIDFAKEQADDDLWEDLLRYSETRPAFIRGLLENVGPEINPIRLIRRIKNGLEIPGLKEALIKILQDFHLQMSLLEGCQTIIDGDSSNLSKRLQRNQSEGFFMTAKATCPICTKPLQENPQRLVVLFLCRHTAHAACVSGGQDIPQQPDAILRGAGMTDLSGRGLSGKIAL
ncbi:vacuolar protein sorting-associated protein 41 [Dendrothele bispora CBS 962.96]|uniref:Vacuolar protein sorting-associated protein 41 n=1 Tax=Dendrothele bispora (strain CBS 962.96) TaxID=1314807 RepID=A0A4S8MJ16_DENBC|nr:vacuolar protein sorting-associated protein 41 [Dendrothele bispora CBS 962.96]